ncbi:GNAT family N-acetyltransferase [Nocardioides sp.]|uniref:GNAT family N-acetyltransferase n=1 Tax=Nocardioides sp. TaxID=35761 RepID=UPI002CFE0143|nr:GNAT family N-acetyltransferase [Nocardioides sp.]HSX69005.1 GNAT family N-acetyltransferase [Nocardioides sp.]
MRETDQVNQGSAVDTGGEIRVVGIEAMPAGWIEKVIELGDRHRSRLGPMPFAGFREAAEHHNIAVAVRTRADGSQDLAGYCLYDPTVRADRYARIAHLCLAEDARGLGVAGGLVDAVMDRCQDRLGLRLKCRDDWEAAARWPSLGFEPVRSRAGRGKTKEPMTEWVKHNDTATTLLSLPLEDPDRLVVAVDNNVFCDLYGTSNRRKQFSGSVALLAAAEQIRLARPFSLTQELNSTVDQRERQALLQSAQVAGMTILKGDRNKVQALRDELLAEVPDAILHKDASLSMDATMVAESILGGAEVFVTRDQNAVTYLGPAAASGRNFAVLDPNELPAFIDRRADFVSYLPTQLEQTEFTTSRGDAATWNPDNLGDLIAKESGERKVAFRQVIKSIAERSAGTDDRQLMLTPRGEVLAIWAAHEGSTTLEVPLLRVKRGDLLPTITRQLSRNLRRRAATAGLTTVRILDDHLPTAIGAELRRDGFIDPAGFLTATVLTTIGTWADVRAAAEAVAESGVVLPEQLSSASEASEYERVLWPAKILHPDVATYIVPIRGVFADDLLGHTSTLLARPGDLGLSREHVYYKSGQYKPVAPGRILWYSSRRDQQVVAASRLVESVVGSPEVLHREFSNIGILTLDQVREARGKRAGTVVALRFADTEIFNRPLSLARVQELSNGAARLTVQSPVRVDSAWFKRLYEEGMRR